MRHVLLCLALLAASAATTAAPAPLERPSRPREGADWLVGDWRMGWQGRAREQGDRAYFWVRFAPDGTYLCGVHGSPAWWAGTWRVSGERLCLTEVRLHDPGSAAVVYEFTPDGSLAGEPPLAVWLEKPPIAVTD